RNSTSTPSLAAARASEPRVRTTPLTCGRHASVATRTFIALLSANLVLPSYFRIACDNNYDFISHSCDAARNLASSGTRGVTMLLHRNERVRLRFVEPELRWPWPRYAPPCERA